MNGGVARLVGEGRLVKVIAKNAYTKNGDSKSVTAIIW
jgi:hypothetical protein